MIYGILLLAFVIRLINLNQSLWLDEAINVLAAKNLSFWHFVAGYPIGDFHPPGWFAILWIWSHLFGFSEISVRMPSIILGVATIWLTYLLGKELFSKKVGLLAALFLAIGPLHVYYSQEARMYSLAAFAVALSCYFLTRFLKRQKNAGIFYAISIFLILYSDYVAYLIIPAQVIYVLWFERKQAVSFLKYLTLGLLTFIPWLAVFPNQLASGTSTAQNVVGWKNVVGGATIKNLLLVGVKSIIGRIKLSENMTIYAGLMSLISIFYGWILFWAVRKLSKEVKFLMCCLLIPIGLAFIISLFVPILAYFRMLFILPAFYLVLAYGLSNLKKRFFIPSITGVIFIATVCLAIYFLNPAYQRENWKGLVNFLDSHSSPDTLVLFEDNNLPAPFIYYDSRQTAAQAGLTKFPAGNLVNVASINELKYHQIFLVDYFVEIADPQRLVDQKLTSLGYRVTRLHDISSLGYIYEYSK